MMAADRTGEIAARVAAAHAAGEPLQIRAGGSKAFFGREVIGAPLDLSGHRGVLRYEPAELVLTARAGTPLAEIETLLAAHRQMLGFEPPHFSGGATLGGAIASGLAGPRRAHAGAPRDFVLGVRIVNGRGEVLRFGGEVIKNVAGFDVSRLMAGALGTLGVLLEISLRVLPLPVAEVTLRRDCTLAEAHTILADLDRTASPLSASCHDGEALTLRLSGCAAAVAATRARLGGEDQADGASFWRALRDHELPFFHQPGPLWRISVPPRAAALDLAALDLSGQWLSEWGGGLRWIASGADPDAIRAAAARLGGHATMFRGGDRQGTIFQPLAPAVLALHRRLKQAFDPRAILNPGRMYRDV
jgi:glycolate oxidase FAD binding subunit